MDLGHMNVVLKWMKKNKKKMAFIITHKE